jgi:hypothetical protein
MKIVINTCYGGFSLSPAGVKRLAELKGRECYFFKSDLLPGGGSRYTPATIDEIGNSMFFSAFDIPNPGEVLGQEASWHTMTPEERKTSSDLYESHSISERNIERTDPDLVRVVEELGGGHREGASGACAELAIVEIPDGVEYTVEEYDGSEHVAEAHRTWR